MKAWYARPTDRFINWYTVFVHAETRAKAKYKIQQVDPGDDYRDSDWNWFTAYREPKLDDKSFALENIQAAGHWIEFEGEPVTWTENECDCELCKDKE